MSMSTHATGFKPPGEKWQRMKAIWDACTAADIEPPREVDAYFEGMPPDSNGVEISESELRGFGALRDWKHPEWAQEGLEIDVSRLPKDITVIRFYNSW